MGIRENNMRYQNYNTMFRTCYVPLIYEGANNVEGLDLKERKIIVDHPIFAILFNLVYITPYLQEITSCFVCVLNWNADSSTWKHIVVLTVSFWMLLLFGVQIYFKSSMRRLGSFRQKHRKSRLGHAMTQLGEGR